MRLSLAAIVVFGVLAPPAAARDVKLSDERSYTRTAEVRKVVPVRRAPERGSPPRRPPAPLDRGPLPRDVPAPAPARRRRRAVGPRPAPRAAPTAAPAGCPPTRCARRGSCAGRSCIDRKRLRIRLLRRGRVVWRAPVGIGAPGMETPRGRFWIREKFRGRRRRSTGRGRSGPARTPRCRSGPAAASSASTALTSPASFPGRPSHGCIRLRNRDIRHLARRDPDRHARSDSLTGSPAAGDDTAPAG